MRGETSWKNQKRTRRQRAVLSRHSASLRDLERAEDQIETLRTSSSAYMFDFYSLTLQKEVKLKIPKLARRKRKPCSA